MAPISSSNQNLMLSRLILKKLQKLAEVVTEGVQVGVLPSLVIHCYPSLAEIRPSKMLISNL